MRTRQQEAKCAKDRACQVLEPLAAYLLAAEQEEKNVMACLRGTSRALRGALDAGRRELAASPSCCLSSLDAAALPRLLSRVPGLRALSVRVPCDAPSDLHMADGFAAGVCGLRSLRSLGLFGRAPAELLSGALCGALSALTELRLDGYGGCAADARRTADDARLASAVSRLPAMPALARLCVGAVGRAGPAVAAARLVARGGCPGLRSLLLGATSAQPQDLGVFADALQAAPGLTELDMHIIREHPAYSDRLFGALGGLAQLQSLYLTCIVDELPAELVRAIGRLSALRKLTLGVCKGRMLDNMRPAEMAAVFGALQQAGACDSLLLTLVGAPTLEAARAASAATCAALHGLQRPPCLTELSVVVDTRRCRWLDLAFVRAVKLQSLTVIANPASAAVRVDARSLAALQAHVSVLRLRNVELVV
jgi:hypothetical protein